MQDTPPADDEDVREQAPVAAPPLRLGAHDRRSALAGCRLQLGEPGCELGRLQVIRIALELRVAPASVCGCLGWPPTTAESD